MLSAPVLQTPANGANLEGAPYDFTWSPVSGAGGYHIKISTSPTFVTTEENDDSIPGASTSYVYSGSLTWDTTHYWQMRTLNSSGTQWGEWSSVRSFVPIQTQSSAPVLQTPANGANLEGAPYDFTWSPVSGAGGYHIKISTSPTFVTTEENDDSIPGASTSYVYSGSLTWDTTHYWQMRTLNSSGTQWGEWSSVRNFVPIQGVGIPIIRVEPNRLDF